MGRKRRTHTRQDATEHRTEQEARAAAKELRRKEWLRAEAWNRSRRKTTARRNKRAGKKRRSGSKWGGPWG